MLLECETGRDTHIDVSDVMLAEWYGSGEDRVLVLSVHVHELRAVMQVEVPLH